MGETTGARAADAGVDPDRVFLPTQGLAEDGQARLPLFPLGDGRLAALAYRSLELLLAGCGRGQAWLAVPVEDLEGMREQAGFDAIALDVELPDDWRPSSGHEEG